MNLRGGNVIYYPDRTNMFGIDSTVECLYFIDVESSRVNLTFFNIPTAVYNFSLEVLTKHKFFLVSMRPMIEQTARSIAMDFSTHPMVVSSLHQTGLYLPSIN